MRNWLSAWVVIGLVATGCGKGGGAGTKDVEARAGAANDKVPADLKAHVKFKVAKAEEGGIAVLIPEAWTESKFIPGKYDPPKDADLGFMTKYMVSSNCDGECVDKDWAPVVEKVEFSRMGGGEKIKDEKLGDSGRLVVEKSGDKVEVRLAVWKKGAPRYFSCSATLEGKAAALSDAFQEACRAMKVLSWK